MAVTKIGIEDTIGGAIGRFGEVLGDVLDKTVFAKGLKEKELRKEPSAMQALVPAATAASRGGQETLTAFAKGLDVNVEFIDEILAFTPTREQATNMAFLEGGGAEKVAAAQISQALFAGETAQAALDVGLPVIQASAMASEGKFDAENFEVQLDSLEFQVENGVIETRLKTDAITAALGLETAQATQAFFNSFDQTTEEGRRNAMEFAFALNNPAMLGHIGLHEQMEFQAALELTRASRGTPQSQADKIGLSIDLQDAWNKAVDRLQEADEEGSDELLEISVGDLNSVRLMIEEANQAGLIYPIDTSVATLGKKFFGGAKLELAATMFDDPRAARFVVEMSDLGITDVEELGRIGLDGGPVVAGESSILDSLPPRLREQIIRDFPAFQESLRTLEVSDVGALKPAIASGIAAATGIPAQAIGTGIDAISSLFTGLSEGLKAAINFVGTQQRRARGN